MARLFLSWIRVSVHGKNHPELQNVRSSFLLGLVQELTTHMMKEERVLFPYIVRMEEAVIQKEPVLPPPFGSVQNPVSMMEHEHDSAGNALRSEATVVIRLRATPVSAIKPSTRRWRTLKLIFTSIFTWRTTSCFLGRLRWKRHTNGENGHVCTSNAH